MSRSDLAEVLVEEALKLYSNRLCVDEDVVIWSHFCSVFLLSYLLVGCGFWSNEGVLNRIVDDELPLCSPTSPRLPGRGCLCFIYIFNSVSTYLWSYFLVLLIFWWSIALITINGEAEDGLTDLASHRTEVAPPITYPGGTLQATSFSNAFSRARLVGCSVPTEDDGAGRGLLDC